MSEAYKPAGYNSVSPYLIMDSASKTIDFLVQVFRGKELRRFTDDSNRIMHAEVQVDDTVIMIADAAEGWPAIAAHVHIYVPDVDEVYKASLAAGAESVQEPVKKSDPDKRGGVKDSGGTTWWIATKVE
jgi:PhnB protein